MEDRHVVLADAPADQRRDESPSGRPTTVNLPVPAPLDPPLTPDDHVDGPGDAPLELVMYGDFQCPYCAAAQSIIRRVRERLDGRLQFAFRHMPLPIHPDAANAAQAAEAAAAQGAFWPMHDQLYAGRGKLSLDDLAGHAAAIGLDGARVRQEIVDGVHAARVARDDASARAAGITGTPAFFVNGVLHEGSFDAGSLVEALEATAPAHSARAGTGDAQ
jgi:protein-disulfide isomerase